MIAEKSIVLVYLVNPREKFWGRLEALTAVGVFIRGMDLNTVEVWARELARGEDATLGPSSVFFPLGRVERILLDEDVGVARSTRSSLLAIVGSDAVDQL